MFTTVFATWAWLQGGPKYSSWLPLEKCVWERKTGLRHTVVFEYSSCSGDIPNFCHIPFLRSINKSSPYPRGKDYTGINMMRQGSLEAVLEVPTAQLWRFSLGQLLWMQCKNRNNKNTLEKKKGIDFFMIWHCLTCKENSFLTTNSWHFVS